MKVIWKRTYAKSKFFVCIPLIFLYPYNQVIFLSSITLKNKKKIVYIKRLNKYIMLCKSKMRIVTKKRK